MGENKKFTLPNETVKVRFIKRKSGIAADVSDNHIISGGMLEGSYRKFPVPMLRSGALKNVLTSEEKEFFEGKNGPYEGQSLSMYSKFWDDKYVTLEKLGITLNLSVAREYLNYKILLGWSSVIAPSLKVFKESPSLGYQFYLERDGEETLLKAKSLGITKLAWKNFNKIEDNREVLSAVIFLMTGKKIAGNATLEYLNTETEKLVDSKAEKFNNLITDSQFETKVLIANAERAGIIKKVKGAYETKDGLAITEKGQPATVQNVVNFLNDPINNEVKELILSRLDNMQE